MRKRRTRFTIEYENRIEYCGTYERAEERVDELFEMGYIPKHETIMICIDGEPTKIYMAW